MDRHHRLTVLASDDQVRSALPELDAPEPAEQCAQFSRPHIDSLSSGRSTVYWIDALPPSLLQDQPAASDAEHHESPATIRAMLTRARKDGLLAPSELPAGAAEGWLTAKATRLLSTERSDRVTIKEGAPDGEHYKRESKSGVKYDVRYRDPSGRQRMRTFVRKINAQQFLASIETDKSRG